ncbi:hypothetical protein [Sulfitobacter aestuariivivens]|uniref:Uncharacterized protein n=1 Tax=Sulfitobacter aestuariivivens TaxID=2766981 RepID=A0A927D2M8_9RHOB|nr:hypothetical protein [Sulfitobacter aestuariivivens]MBD3663905.1 hypothetical protein [Sulfitobacter aestuariivivens]
MKKPANTADAPARLRRPEPERTEPNRGILGVFGQSSWGAPPQGSHPLGFDEDTGTPVEPTGHGFLDDSVQEASELVDAHIRQGLKESAGADESLLGRMAALYGSAQANDLTALATQFTRVYADMATQWIDIAGSIRDQLGNLRGATASAPAASTGIASPSMVLRASKPVETRVDMFRAAGSLSAQPLTSEDANQDLRITTVSVENGQLRITIPADQPAGTYHGLLVEKGAGPAGTVTVRVFETSEDGS